MPKVLNIRQGLQGGARIDRATPFGNPFQIGKDGSREDVIRKYREWIVDQPMLIARVRAELKGRDLVCWCAPKACHGDVLLEIANAP